MGTVIWAGFFDFYRDLSRETIVGWAGRYRETSLLSTVIWAVFYSDFANAINGLRSGKY